MISKTKLKKYLMMLLFPVLLISVNSCYDDYGLSTSDYDIVLTQFSDQAEFGQYKTFAVADTIFHITEDGEDSPLLSRRYDDDIIERIKSNMLALNFEEESNPQVDTPDVVVVVAATASRNVNIWTWYPGYPGWGWWGYYPWTSISTYEVGTLVFSMLDTKDYDPENELYGGIWIAGINGILQQSNADISRINSHIDQAFAQSQYLAPNE